jgi:predicted CoA-binding protein
MIDPTAAHAFLSLDRVAVVGASADPKSFGNTIYRELRSHGQDVVPVNPNVDAIEGVTCYPDVTAVPGQVDGVMVMVRPDVALDVIRASAARGIDKVWLFKGLGAPGAISDETVELCDQLDLDVVAGACPMMFLEPVAWFHRAHRGMRHLNHSLAR